MVVHWGLVGLGRISDRSIAPAIAASTSGELVACASRRVEDARQFASKHGVDQFYASYEELVQDPAIDAVFVAAPNSLHHSIVMAAIDAGKHVLCEKPLALGTKQAEEMVAASSRAGVLLRVGLQMRFHAVLRGALDLVQSGKLGDIREVSIQRYSPMNQSGLWRRDLATAGAGVLTDAGVHLLDLVQWILSDHPCRAYACSFPPRASGLPDETTTLLLQFAGGCQATIRLSREMPFAANDLQIFGTRGMLLTGPLRYADTFRLTLQTLDEQREWEYPSEDLYRLEIDAFAEDLAGGRSVLATGEEGLALASLTDALIESMKTGAAVLL